MRGSRSSIWLALALLSAALPVLGCVPPEGDGEPVVIETEDVTPELDDDLDLSSDRKAARRPAASGKLPGDFPEGLPIYKPSTISDIGQGEQENFVQFMSQDDAGAVRSWYPGALARGGWSVESGPGGALVASRDQRRARISIQASGPVTLIRVDY